MGKTIYLLYNIVESYDSYQFLINLFYMIKYVHIEVNFRIFKTRNNNSNYFDEI